MSDRSVVVYLYDGSYEGLLSCVFESFARKEIRLRYRFKIRFKLHFILSEILLPIYRKQNVLKKEFVPKCLKRRMSLFS